MNNQRNAESLWNGFVHLMSKERIRCCYTVGSLYSSAAVFPWCCQRKSQIPSMSEPWRHKLCPVPGWGHEDIALDSKERVRCVGLWLVFLGAGLVLNVRSPSGLMLLLFFGLFPLSLAHPHEKAAPASGRVIPPRRHSLTIYTLLWNVIPSLLSAAFFLCFEPGWFRVVWNHPGEVWDLTSPSLIKAWSLSWQLWALQLSQLLCWRWHSVVSIHPWEDKMELFRSNTISRVNPSV